MWFFYFGQDNLLILTVAFFPALKQQSPAGAELRLEFGVAQKGLAIVALIFTAQVEVQVQVFELRGQVAQGPESTQQ